MIDGSEVQAAIAMRSSTWGFATLLGSGYGALKRTSAAFLVRTRRPCRFAVGLQPADEVIR
jgi:hypothetical protein